MHLNVDTSFKVIFSNLIPVDPLLSDAKQIEGIEHRHFNLNRSTLDEASDTKNEQTLRLLRTSCSCAPESLQCSCTILRRLLLAVVCGVTPIETASNVVNQLSRTMLPMSLVCLRSFPSQRANTGEVLSSEYSRYTFNALLKRQSHRCGLETPWWSIELCTYHASFLLKGKYDTSSSRQPRLVMTIVSSNSPLLNEYFRGEPVTSCSKKHSDSGVISDGVTFGSLDTACAYYLSGNRRNFSPCSTPESRRIAVYRGPEKGRSGHQHRSRSRRCLYSHFCEERCMGRPWSRGTISPRTTAWFGWHERAAAARSNVPSWSFPVNRNVYHLKLSHLNAMTSEMARTSAVE